jgi:molecular chaperone DnaK
MRKEAEANADADKKAKEEVDVLNNADQMIFQTEKQLKEFGDKLSADKKSPIETGLEALKKAYESKDLEAIKPALDNINEAWKQASEEMYKAQQEAGGADAPPMDGADAASSSDDDVEDVDFEEVK